MSALLQLVGVLCAVVGGTWALGPWFLLGAGLALLVVPELLDARSRRRTDEPDEEDLPSRRHERGRRAA